jgi:ketosteroid isomerase-like protein
LGSRGVKELEVFGLHICRTYGQLLPPNSDFVKGTALIRAFWQGAINSGIKEAKLTTLEIEVHGQTALEVGQYFLWLEGGKVADQGKYIVIGKNDKGKWKLHRDIWNSSLK